jgi:hypothetical protein
MSYTIWLIPKEMAVKSYLASIVRDLVHEYHGPEFEPHITLLGDVSVSLEEIIENCTLLATKTKPLTLETGTVEYSTTYYQNLFVRIKPTPQLMTAYTTAKDIFNLTTPSVFMPHMSLLYGNDTFDQKHHMMETLEFTPQRFTVSSLIITPGGENPPSEWKHLAEIPLN